jgi:hypothetical protein
MDNFLESISLMNPIVAFIYAKMGQVAKQNPSMVSAASYLTTTSRECPSQGAQQGESPLVNRFRIGK